MQDATHAFREFYTHSLGEDALKQLIPTFDTSYDRWEIFDEEGHHLINYADALVYLRPDEARLANLAVQSGAPTGEFQQALITDENFLLLTSHPHIDLDSIPMSGSFGELEESYWTWLHGGPEPTAPRLAEHISHQKRWKAFVQRWPHLREPATALSLIHETRHQLVPVEGDLVVVLMEPVRIDWQLPETDLLLLFPDVACLQHCLALPQVKAALERPGCWWHILDHYPSETLSPQPPLPTKLGHIALLPMAPSEEVERFRAPLVESLKTVLSGPLAENSAANWLFQVGRNYSWRRRAHRLGKRRLTMHRANCGQEAWHSRHKGRPPAGVLIGPCLPQHRSSKKSRPKRRMLKRIAHVVPQLVDGGHAPTRLYRTLVRHHDHERYEIHMLVTEEFVFRTAEYPFARFVSKTTLERAPETTADLRKRGVYPWMAPHNSTYESVSKCVAQELSRREIDTAIFHAATPINLRVAELCDVPCRALFDHGSMPQNAGFDLYLAATKEEVQRGLDGPVVVLPHVVDVRETWDPEPTPLSWFGLDEDAQLLTTISFHLEDRLSGPMCEAVAEILVRCPRAHYLPMGPVSEAAQQRIRRSFLRRGVADRLRFLGRQDNPSQLARSMTLYLNEFPFGGGVALLDAMAAGLPIVSMYDPDGPHQARYAASAIGLDRVLENGDFEGYVELACSLLANRALYAQWSRAMVKAYEARGTATSYVSLVEKALERASLS